MNYDCSISYGLRLTTPIVNRGLCYVQADAISAENIYCMSRVL